MKKFIVAKGIRVHNLKNIDIKIPLNKLTVITGVSGSGKSSLAFNTLYAEGQRRYVESFSSYARQFLERIDKPNVDHIEGIQAAIAIEQKNPVKNRRSTVGTATEIHDYFRLLFSKIGKTFCKECGNIVKKDSVSDILSDISHLEIDTKALIVFPVEIAQNIDIENYVALLKERGIVRVLAFDEMVDISDELAIAKLRKKKRLKHIFGIVDRIKIKDNMEERLTDAIETAYTLGSGRVSLAFLKNNQCEKKRIYVSWEIKWKYSSSFMCNECDIEYTEPEPQLFSFNNPLGACKTCQGFGNTIEVDMDLVIPDKTKSINDGAIAPWNTPKFLPFKEELIESAAKHDVPVDIAYKDLTDKQLGLIMNGTKDFYGITAFFKKLDRKKYKMHVRVFLSKYRGYNTCPSCSGVRLNSSALDIKINGYNIADICAMNIENSSAFFKGLKLSKYEKNVASMILNEIEKRLEYMVHVGLGYLTLDRLTRSLSGGEAQRVNITTSLGSSLVNTLYILDEPSIGLHSRDTDRLIWTLKKLRDIGNTVIVVEHDKAIISAADNILDIGPDAGENGGEVVYQGCVSAILSKQDTPSKSRSLTVKYLSGINSINVPVNRRKPSKKQITIQGASQNNLKCVNVSFPLNTFVCVTGVSGSGKSTLIKDTLYCAVKRKINLHSGNAGKHKSITGTKHIKDIILADQSPIGKTPRSNPITYVKVFDEIRKLFASTRSAKALNKKAGHFSFNIPGGRCDNCDGGGQEKIEMQFLADIYVTCEYCQGKRFRHEILEIKYQDKNIHEVLCMTVDEAAAFFKDSSRISIGLQYLQETGLGYLRLGQSATTLSGGEAQRLKLATFMAKSNMDGTLFIFDEPTTGLHFHDIQKLLNCFNKLIDLGHSLIVIEHNIDVIKCSDYVIDLGPEGGDNGGEIIGCGTPEEIAEIENSYTGKYLRECLDQS